jgi:hypothetical protein
MYVCIYNISTLWAPCPLHVFWPLQVFVMEEGDEELVEVSEKMDKKVNRVKWETQDNMCNKHRKNSRCFLSAPRTKQEEMDLNPSARNLG